MHADLQDAVLYATQMHFGQERSFGDDKGLPYIIHPIRVMSALARERVITIGKGAPDRKAILIAGVLHDVVEDTPATLEDVAGMFGSDVASIVDYVTRREDEPYRQFIERSARHPLAIWVKLADLHDNRRGLGKSSHDESLKERYDRAIQYLHAAARL